MDLFTPTHSSGDNKQLLGRLFRQGREAQHAGRYEEAIKVLYEYSEHLPSDIKHEPYYWVSDSLFKLGDYWQASEVFLKFLRGCSSSAYAVTQLKTILPQYKENATLREIGKILAALEFYKEKAEEEKRAKVKVKLSE